MLNKDDKNYITDAISDTVKKSEKKLEEKIRHNGVMIENLEDLILRLAESMDTTNHKLDRLERRFDQAGIDNFPILWEEVKKHAKRITTLEVKVA